MKKIGLLFFLLTILFSLTVSVSPVFAAGVVKVEAESGQLYDGANIQEGRGSSGEMYIGLKPDIIGVPSRAEFSVTADKSGSYEFTFIYSAASGSESRKADIFVNGNRKHLDIRPTDNWDTWSDTKLLIDLNAGDNTIILSSTEDYDDNLVKTPNIDFFTYILADKNSQSPNSDITPAPSSSVSSPSKAPQATSSAGPESEPPTRQDYSIFIVIVVVAGLIIAGVFIIRRKAL